MIAKKVSRVSVYTVFLFVFCFIPTFSVNLLAYSEVEKYTLTPDEKNNIDIFSKTNKSVVYVTNTQLQRDRFSLNIYEIPAGAGTGIVWDKSGHIVTNFHVIKNAKKIKITLWDHSSWEAKIVGVAENKDLAVLKIGAPSKLIFPIQPGDSSKLEVGRKVLAIGNPFGLDTTLTVGVVSALDREIEIDRKKIAGLIQTDAAINPGNSGGPLLNSKGYLVGINTVIIGPGGGSAGVGFAIPVNEVKKIVPQLINFGQIMRPIMGIHVLHDSVARRYRIKGAIVLEVLPGSAAEKAGMIGISRDRRDNIFLGDIIVKIDKHTINSQDELLSTLEYYKPGNRIVVETIRGNSKKKLNLTLQQPE